MCGVLLSELARWRPRSGVTLKGTTARTFISLGHGRAAMAGQWGGHRPKRCCGSKQCPTYIVSPGSPRLSAPSPELATPGANPSYSSPAWSRRCARLRARSSGRSSISGLAENRGSRLRRGRRSWLLVNPTPPGNRWTSRRLCQRRARTLFHARTPRCHAVVEIDTLGNYRSKVGHTEVFDPLELVVAQRCEFVDRVVRLSRRGQVGGAGCDRRQGAVGVQPVVRRVARGVDDDWQHDLRHAHNGSGVHRHDRRSRRSGKGTPRR